MASFEPSIRKEILEKARVLQDLHYKLLHGCSYDVFPRKDFHKFEMLLYNYYPKEVSRKLARVLTKRKEDLVFQVVLVNYYINGEMYSAPVLRVMENGKAEFYDDQCCRYSDWDEFCRRNKLPKSIMIFPKNGTYKESCGELELTTCASPAAIESNESEIMLYSVADFASAISTIAPTIFGESSSEVLQFISAVSNGYKAFNHLSQLYDRYNQGLSIDLADETALMHWSHVGNSFISFALTYYKSNSSQDSNSKYIYDLIHLLTHSAREFYNKNPRIGLNVIKGQVLCQYLTLLTNDAINYLQTECNFADLDEIMYSARNLINTEVQKSMRWLIHVDEDKLQRVVSERNSIPSTIHEANEYEELAQNVIKLLTAAFSEK